MLLFYSIINYLILFLKLSENNRAKRDYFYESELGAQVIILGAQAYNLDPKFTWWPSRIN